METPNEKFLGEELIEIEDPVPMVLRPTPDDPPWNSIVAIAAWVASVLAIMLIPTLVVLPYILSEGPAFSERQALGEFLQQDPTAILLQIVAIIPAHIITLLLAWAIVTKLNRFSFRDTLGWEPGGMRWRDYLAILVVFFAFAAVVGNYFPEQENEMLRILRSSRSAVFLVAFMATFTAPLVEEVIYRGLLYSAFQRTVGVVGSVIAVTLLFALVHVPQYYPSYSSISLLLLLSLILTVVRARSRNLWPCVVLHTIFNGTQSILLIIEPYIQSAEPVIQPSVGVLLK